MNFSLFIILASTVLGLASIPFITPQFENDYGPTGAILLNTDEFNFSEHNVSMQEVPGAETTSYGPDGFVKEIQTPYAKFVFKINYDKIEQEMLRPDRKVTITKTYDTTSWVLQKQEEGLLNITQTPDKRISLFTMPDGWIKIVREDGTTSEEWYGLNFTLLNQSYQAAKEILEDEVEIMEEMKRSIINVTSTTTTTTSSTTTITISHIMINEFIPDPEGNDTALMPNGEWVELYNPTNSNIDVGGWMLYDSNDNNELEISTSNTNTGNTIVTVYGWLAIYRNGDSDFSLNNGGDTIRLFNLNNSLIDSYTYTINPGVNNTIGRCPDGSDNWSINIAPTPGSANNCS